MIGSYFSRMGMVPELFDTTIIGAMCLTRPGGLSSTHVGTSWMDSSFNTPWEVCSGLWRTMHSLLTGQVKVRALAGLPSCSVGTSLKKEMAVWSLLERYLPNKEKEHSGMTMTKCVTVPCPKVTVCSIVYLHFLISSVVSYTSTV